MLCNPSTFLFSASSVLYFSIHRYEQGRFWPHLKASNWSTVGLGQGQGFTINVPWNQVSVFPPKVSLVLPSHGLKKGDCHSIFLCLQVGMRDIDYIAAFLHILMPVAFEVLESQKIWG